MKEDVKSTKEELEKLANVMQQEKDENVKQLNDTKINLEEEITKLKNNVSEEKAEKKKIEEALEIAKGKNNVSFLIVSAENWYLKYFNIFLLVNFRPTI